MKQPSRFIVIAVAIALSGASMLGGSLIEASQDKPDHTQEEQHVQNEQR